MLFKRVSKCSLLSRRGISVFHAFNRACLFPRNSDATVNFD